MMEKILLDFTTKRSMFQTLKGNRDETEEESRVKRVYLR